MKLMNEYLSYFPVEFDSFNPPLAELSGQHNSTSCSASAFIVVCVCFFVLFVCLFSELWLEWLSDEVPLCGPVQEEVDRVIQLFEQAVQDYLCMYR